mmetsp:Transcript_16006/g.36376  ORF Transcript_16006/g.36376 Transcript_16006/m.36376 type:complete len:105 (-) Transcript_16006:130-444(-)
MTSGIASQSLARMVAHGRAEHACAWMVGILPTRASTATLQSLSHPRGLHQHKSLQLDHHLQTVDLVTTPGLLSGWCRGFLDLTGLGGSWTFQDQCPAAYAPLAV